MRSRDLIYAPEIFGRLKPSWTSNEFKSAVKRFKHNAPSVPIPRLYDAYLWLKEEIDHNDIESEKQFSFFIENFLRVLEDRGAAQSEVYSEVLRDSDEYKYLKGLFHNDEPEIEDVTEYVPERKPEKPVKEKRVTLKNILRDRKLPLSDFDIDSWHRLVDEHFIPHKTEEAFVKICSATANNISIREIKEPYHIEIIIVYAFERLISYQSLSLKTKNFAMTLLNMMIDRNEIWTELHKTYRDIIKK